MATIDTPEYKFPDEVEDTAAEDSLDIEIEDDTPVADKGRQPMPQDVVEELENDELDDYSDKAKERLKQLK